MKGRLYKEDLGAADQMASFTNYIAFMVCKHLYNIFVK
jgi:hypothetical protein